MGEAVKERNFRRVENPRLGNIDRKTNHHRGTHYERINRLLLKQTTIITTAIIILHSTLDQSFSFSLFKLSLISLLIRRRRHHRPLFLLLLQKLPLQPLNLSVLFIFLFFFLCRRRFSHLSQLVYVFQ